MAIQVMIVDDERSIRLTLQAFLEAAGYQVAVAADAEEACDLLREKNWDVVVSDVILPGTSGVELLRTIRGVAPHSQVIMMTGEPTVETAVEAVRVGARDYLIKPVNRSAVLRAVAAAAQIKMLEDEKRRLEKDNRRYQRDLEALVKERTQKLEETLHDLRGAMEGTILAMAHAVETRDPYTAGHQQHVARLAQAIARQMKLPEDRILATYYAGLVHDLGKISVSAEILSYPARLSPEQMGLIKGHPATGHEILSRVRLPWPVAKMVLQHHERLDGSGYPRGLKDRAIMKEARILAVADVVEAMASHRPYRPAVGIDAALAEIEAKAGILYDPRVVACCVRLFREQDFTFHADQ